MLGIFVNVSPALKSLTYVKQLFLLVLMLFYLDKLILNLWIIIAVIKAAITST